MASKTIGFLIATDKPSWKKYTGAFEQKLKSLGWNIVNAPTANNMDVVIKYSPAKGDSGQYAGLAGQFVNPNPVDVIVTSGIGPAAACQAATANIPIVFASVGDLTGLGGRNLTGGWNQQVDFNHVNARVKHLLNEWKNANTAVTALNNLGVIYNDTSTSGTSEMTLVMRAAAALNPVAQAVRTQADIQHIRTNNVDAFYVCSDPLITQFVGDLETACGNIFTAHAFSEYVDGPRSGSCSYGPNMRHMFRTAAEYADKIMNGTAPSALPIFTGDIEQRP